ncbi:hypothetical protein RB195_006684 [Necator americanus]|uniref:Reverse transcriptase domain-containing protein n=1 Tax=Necator americanus TaxID=51031 RepID=A0ABR1BVI8_NECAM
MSLNRNSVQKVQLNNEELQKLLNKMSSDERKELTDTLKQCTTEMTMTRGVPITAAVLGSLYYARTRLPPQYHFGPKGWPFYAIMGIGTLTTVNILSMGKCRDRVQPIIGELWQKYNTGQSSTNYDAIRRRHREEYGFTAPTTAQLPRKIDDMQTSTDRTYHDENDNRLPGLLSASRLIHGNSLFMKKDHRRWTWGSPSGATRAEIDHILTNLVVITVSSVRKYGLATRWKKNICYRQRRRKEVVYDDCVLEDSLSQGDWHIEEEEDPNVDYEMLLRGLQACAERASKPRTTNLDRISKTTKELLEGRRALIRLDPNASHIARLVANTSCRKALQEDLLKYRQKKILEATQRRTSLKKCRRDLHEYNIPLAALLSEDGTRTSSRREMEIITERFYSNLFRSSTPVSSPIIPTGEAPPRILPSEVRVAIKSMKPGTAPGPDFISADFLRAGGHPLHVILAAHMTSYLQKERIPDQWKTSQTVLIHKKGDREDLRNYRAICLLSVLYTVFTKIILTRISRTLDEAQPQEKAGFRQGFSCFDHIQTVPRVIKVCRKYRLPLVLTFVDYEKTFDSIETNAILSALVDQGMDASYVRTLANCYDRCTTRIQLFHNLIIIPLTIPIGNGVRQGDTISPKLFTAALQWIMKSLSWEERGIHVDGRFLSNLLFADDIVLFSSSTNEAETMLNELNEAGKRIGLRINRKKTQLMKNAYCEDGGVQLEGSQIVKLRHTYTSGVL